MTLNQKILNFFSLMLIYVNDYAYLLLIIWKKNVNLRLFITH